jgi:Flp pilus assembly pilin Flp
MLYSTERPSKRWHIVRCLANDRGAASIEYAIIGSLIAAVIVFIVATLGTQVRTLFETVKNAW